MENSRIIRAKDYARREGAKSVVERIVRISAQLAHRRLLDTPFVGGAPVGRPVLAEVNHGQWMAFCECGGPEAVDPDEPIFYCFSCGNHATKGRPRPVTFPQQREIEEIEQVLLERPMEDGGGANEIDRVFMARPLVGVVDGVPVVMHRSWKPGETVEELRAQNGMIGELRKMKDESGKKDNEPPSPALPPNGRAHLGEGSDSEEVQ
jgi:hypothetical protein